MKDTIGHLYRRFKASDIAKRMMSGAFWSFTGTALGKFCVFLTGIICARILGKEQFGELGMVRSTIGMFIILGAGGIGVTATRFIALYRRDQQAHAASIYHLSTRFAPYLQDISFDVREGEIFGLYGLVGAGRTELLETIFGVRTRASGRVYYNGQLMNFDSAKEAMEHGFALITEERKMNGMFAKGDLIFNTTITNLSKYMSGAALSNPKMRRATENEIRIMHTKCMGPDDSISGLSGGNQQKVIFGKWLERDPVVFMMDDPTRGIDVGAKYEIYQLIIEMAKRGKTILVVSSEMPEILGITNRIGVMSNGRLAGIVNTKETDQEELLRLSAKYL